MSQMIALSDTSPERSQYRVICDSGVPGTSWKRGWGSLSWNSSSGLECSGECVAWCLIGREWKCVCVCVALLIRRLWSLCGEWVRTDQSYARLGTSSMWSTGWQPGCVSGVSVLPLCCLHLVVVASLTFFPCVCVGALYHTLYALWNQICLFHLGAPEHRQPAH